MKSILISIKPKWCEKIASGKQTIEVRKSAPKEVPFKAYIYCTQDRKNLLPIEHGKVLQKVNFWENTDAYYGFGKVIGEFICDKVYEWKYDYCDGADIDDDLIVETFLDREEINIYAKGKTIYGWHISDLKIYDKPKKLSEFYVYKKVKGGCENCAYYRTPTLEFCQDCKSGKQPKKYLTRPPQSWCYVEELENEQRTAD